MNSAVNTLAVAIAREGPVWIMTALIVVVAAALLYKCLPAWQKYMERKAATEEERERRKARESEERARTEGQWIMAIDRSNDVSERAVAALDASTQVIGRLSDKLDKDAAQSERIETVLNEVKTDVKVLNERIRT